MTQIQQLGFLANNLTVNTAANTATFTNILVVGNSSVNVVVNSSSVYVSGVALGSGGGTNAAAQYAWTNTQSFSNTITFTGAILANTVNAASYTVGTSFIANATQLTTTYPTVHTANVSVNGAIIANGGAGSSGQVLTSSAGGNVYWAAAAAGVNTAASYAFSNTTASGNNSTGAITIVGGLGVNGNIYTASRVGFANTSNVSVVYTYYNQSVGGLDTVFG